LVNFSPQGFKPKQKHLGLPKGTVLTQGRHSQRRVIFEFENLGEFDVIWKPTLGFEAVAQRNMFYETTKVKIS
jgi:hypothetical protein